MHYDCISPDNLLTKLVLAGPHQPTLPYIPSSSLQYRARQKTLHSHSILAVHLFDYPLLLLI